MCPKWTIGTLKKKKEKEKRKKKKKKNYTSEKLKQQNY